jgi:hypothetical protein
LNGKLILRAKGLTVNFELQPHSNNCQAVGPTIYCVISTQPFRLGFSNSIKCILNFFSRLFLRNDSFVFENDSKTRFADFDRVALSMFGFEL